MPRLGGAYCFRRVRSQRKSVDWGTKGPALGGAYDCYAHISSSLHNPNLFLGLNSDSQHRVYYTVLPIAPASHAWVFQTQLKEVNLAFVIAMDDEEKRKARQLLREKKRFGFPIFMPALAEHTVFVVSVRNESVDLGTMGPALGRAYECYAHISTFHFDTI